ncbi:Uncharacterised protein [Bordetella pertussis]|nr:Uncharacterised protein [Bordetella pertussis]CFM91005.1 Uncharacterised protein [Bordetella pertussis]CFO10750.1 Uncharacterised protein [Bordetella pertussis]CFO80486.1 Uncharacterised protein [Bordetella pertussis]CFW20267.1 Uncharacterised protein [Bordetella pertussis]
MGIRRQGLRRAGPMEMAPGVHVMPGIGRARHSVEIARAGGHGTGAIQGQAVAVHVPLGVQVVEAGRAARQAQHAAQAQSGAQRVLAARIHAGRALLDARHAWPAFEHLPIAGGGHPGGVGGAGSLLARLRPGRRRKRQGPRHAQQRGHAAAHGDGRHRKKGKITGAPPGPVQTDYGVQRHLWRRFQDYPGACTIARPCDDAPRQPRARPVIRMPRRASA